MKETVKLFFDEANSSIKAEGEALYENAIGKIDIDSFDTPEEFYYAVMYPLELFLASYLANEKSLNQEAVFIYTNSQFLDNAFAGIFKRVEGQGFSFDKSQTIISSILEFYETGKEIEFDYDRGYTYHLPKKVLRTHDEIIRMYDALKSLFCGENEKYLNELSVIKKSLAG